VLDGQPVAFLSCSEKFKSSVAYPVRAALADIDVRGVIVGEEPQLPRTDWGPEDKVESYLNASDAFLALCTADNVHTDGRIECRQNIIDEVQRARNKPHLRSRIMVLKVAEVQLPSNINPIHEPLDLENLGPCIDLIIRQLRTWGVLAGAPAIPHTQTPLIPVDRLLAEVKLGEFDKATALAYQISLHGDRAGQLAAVAELLNRLRPSADDENLQENTGVHVISTVLDGFARIDHTLVSPQAIEELSLSPETTHRIAAVDLLWDLAEAAPGMVPLGLLGRLARPNDEDWYVEAPAMAVVKLLMLTRRHARVIFDRLAASTEAEDRYAVAAALLDLSRVQPAAVPPDLAHRLVNDNDELVKSKAQEVVDVISSLPKDAYDQRYQPFGI
jgi:hypothetical protein